MGLGSVFSMMLLVGLPALRSQPYSDHLLVEVDVANAAALDRLLASGVVSWLEHPRPGVVPVLVSPERRAMLWADGWSLRVLSADVQRDVDEEALRLTAQPPIVAGGGDFFLDFRELAVIEAEIDATVAAAPDLVTYYEIGESVNGRTIRGVRITAPGDDSRPAVLVTAGQHAREWIAVSSGMYVIDQLVTRAAEPEFAAMLQAVQILVIPVVNPDGYEYTWSGERYWRKNRRNGVGVDTNRNFGHNWGGEGASNVPEDENYAGTAAFSEPESAAVRDFVQAHPELVAHLDVHSFGQLVLYPWGDIDEPAPDDAALAATATAMANAMGATGTDYTPIQGVHLYPAAGNVIDWAYGDAGLHAVTMELRPLDPEVGFVLPPGQIGPVGDEVLAGLWVLLSWANGVVPDPTGGESSSGDPTDATDATDATDGGSAASSNDGDSATQGMSSGNADDTQGNADATASLTAGPELTSVSDDGTAGGSGEGGPAADGDSGCGCNARHPSSSAWWLGVVLFGTRRRARGRSR